MYIVGLFLSMPFDVGAVVNASVDGLLRAPIVSAVARNPIYTALLVTLVLMLIVMFVFRESDGPETVLVMTLRAGFWAFLFLVGVLFLQNKVLTQETGALRASEAYGGLFGATASGPEIVPVSINTDFTRPV